MLPEVPELLIREIGENEYITLSGNIYVGDPCYIYDKNNDEMKHKISNLLLSENIDDKNKVTVITIDNVKSYWFGTAHGDGIYSLKFSNDIINSNLMVDSGMLAFIPVESALLINPNITIEKLNEMGHVIYVGNTLKDFNHLLDNGDIEIGPYKIQTSSTDIDDDWDVDDDLNYFDNDLYNF